MKPNQFALIKWKVLGIAHIKAVVFHAGNKVIFLCINLYGQIKEELIPLGFYSRIVFGDIQVFHSENIGALGQCFWSTKYG